MAYPFLDAFTDTDGVSLTAHNAGYSAVCGGLLIASNGFKANSAGGNSLIAWTSDGALSATGYAQIVMAAVNTGYFVGVGLRMGSAGSGNGYALIANSSASYLLRLVSAVYTILGTGPAYAATDVLRLEVDASENLRPMQNGSTTSIGIVQDSLHLYTSGYGGLAGYDADSAGIVRGDSFEVGNIGGGGVSIPKFMDSYRRRRAA